MKKLFIAVGGSLLLSFFVAYQLIHVIEVSQKVKQTRHESVSHVSGVLSPTPKPTKKPIISSPLVRAISPTKSMPTPTKSSSTVTGSPTVVPTRAPLKNTVKVMPLGDSITAGAMVFGGYRTLLWQMLVENDKKNIDFVGSQSSGTVGDVDNEGHIGWTIAQLDTYAYNWMQLYQPDIVLLHIGTNDIDLGTSSNDMLAGLSSLLGHIYAGKPDTYVVIATLIPASRGNRDVWSTYNASLPGIAAQYGGSHNITVVNMAGALSESDLLDGLHPNQGGYNKMAFTWYPTVSMIYRQMVQ